MNDEDIIRLYFDRNEQAVTESSAKYGAYCSAIARNILSDDEDVKECVNDTWLRAWNAIPPARPSVLSAFLGKITRNLSFDRYRSSHRQKRSDGKVNLVLDELKDIVSGNDDPEDQAMEKELIAEINLFLKSLPDEKRYMFILRYWHSYEISGISKRLRISEGNIMTSLSRIRKSLKEHLTGRGYSI